MPEDTGLYDKYLVVSMTKKIIVEDAFVLRVKDPFARVAMLAYAESCEDTHPRLAKGIRDRIEAAVIEDA
jgi:hypothetical protein